MGKGSLDFATKVPGEQNAPPLLPPRPGDSRKKFVGQCQARCLLQEGQLHNKISGI